MNIIKLLFQLFVLYLLYKFVFDFILPLYRASRQMRGKMSEMQQKMQEFQQQQQQQQASQQQAAPKMPEKKTVAGDYIEYEELK